MLCENVDNYKRRNEIINGSNQRRPLERLLVFCFVFTFNEQVYDQCFSYCRKNAFHCWLENMKPLFQEENPDLSDGEIMKLAMKQWRETPKEEKQVWEKTAKGNVSTMKNEVKESGQGDDSEIGEKKRKRLDDESEEGKSETSLEEKENISKKVKTFDKQKVNSKLAGFAFSK